MKNIHILPTDNPSKIFKDSFGYYFSFESFKRSNLYNQNIYITSDEEIKEGDWVLFTSTNEVIKVPLGGFKGKVCKKIILTTDQDLIKDGIQTIDDEFLKWLVKNPSCEFIEVKYVKTPDGIFYNQDNVPYGYYKIIIPKEETKQETLEEITKQIQNECHEFVKSVPNVNYQDATNTFLFMKLAELTLKTKKL